jgi:hypothetical protein
MEQRSAPLEHTWSILQKPFYFWRCPNCKQHKTATNVTAVPFVMISARPIIHVEKVLNSWTQEGFAVKLMSTLNISRNFQDTRCPLKNQWAVRLFYVYQQVFREALQSYPINTHFVFLEDDAMLEDGVGLREELAFAIDKKLDYYSFYKNGKDSCLYTAGTVSQVISRKMMQSLLQVGTKSFCRLPIDMCIAKVGPWFVTQRRLVKHIGKRYTLSRR